MQERRLDELVAMDPREADSVRRRAMSARSWPSPEDSVIAFWQVAATAEHLVQGWVSNAAPKDRDVEIRKHVERSRAPFGKEPKRTPIDPTQ